ncbi:MAG: glycogen/starch/alpha-glucan phosphorylase [Lachnospiraceae bacterium]
MNLEKTIEDLAKKPIRECDIQELYDALLRLCNKLAMEKETIHGKKKVYYISAEFLIGKLLSNNLINLGIYEQVRKLLEENGFAVEDVEEYEAEPSLGNGGLGRLAACFLDSMATLGIMGDGVGLNYHLGLFRQVFKENRQEETPDPWIEKDSWLIKTDHVYQVPFKEFTLNSTMYDILVTGYNNQTNRLHLFDVDTVEEGIVEEGISFDKEDIKKNLTLFLYPDDSDVEGRKLRIYQQYFMVSNAAQLILQESEERGSNLHDLADYATIQINDTHPTMVIPELIRLLQGRGIEMDEAIHIVSNCCAYTNHTILAEALEKWPLSYLEEVVPHLVPIIKELDQRVKSSYQDKKVHIIDGKNLVHMAHIDIHYGYSVNGVAALHTEILKQSELKPFYDIYPEKFNNKTNGITFRRWLLHCNRPLTLYLSELLGDGFKTDATKLEGLLAYKESDEVLERLYCIKQENKKALAEYLFKTQQVVIDVNSIYDIQVKRLHEYKRQQMNALYAIRKYQEIKAGKKPQTPITVIFGAKAAKAYTIAKDIIHLILCLQEIINNDPEVSPYLKVVMVENYNVTKAEKLIPACDISEQISLASKEASGTGNMKFMLNGAVTLGTMDGANVEIVDLVGKENSFIFGASSDEVIGHYKKEDYDPKEFYKQNTALKQAVDFLVSDTLMKIGDEKKLKRLYKELLSKDYFMTFLDFEAYCNCREEAYKAYEDNRAWSQKMLVNIAKAGYFSSDRTISEYAKVWGVETQTTFD